MSSKGTVESVAKVGGWGTAVTLANRDRKAMSASRSEEMGRFGHFKKGAIQCPNFELTSVGVFSSQRV